MAADAHSLESFQPLEGLAVPAPEQIFLAHYKENISLSQSKKSQMLSLT